MIAYTATAQIQVGFRAGATAWWTASKSAFMAGLTPIPMSFTGAGFVEIPISGRIAIRPEISYTQKGFVLKEGLNFTMNSWNFPNSWKFPMGAEIKHRTPYIEVPLLLKINLTEGLLTQTYLLTGASVGYAIDGRIRIYSMGAFTSRPIDVGMNLDSQIYNHWDFSGVVGLGVRTRIGWGKIIAEARYEHGLSRQYRLLIANLSIRHRGASVNIGYSFPIRGK